MRWAGEEPADLFWSPRVSRLLLIPLKGFRNPVNNPTEALLQ